MSYRWKAIFGEAMSIVTHKPSQYAKDITLRYPLVSTFEAKKLRISLDNFTGKEDVTFSSVTVGKAIHGQDVDESTICDLTFDGHREWTLKPGQQKYSDPLEYEINKGEVLIISMYFKDFTHLRSGVYAQGPFSKGYFGEGDFTHTGIMDHSLSMKTPWIFFLNEVDVYTDYGHVLTCYGDSITSQDWPDYLQKIMFERDEDVSVIRRAVSGTRILREYSCVQYEAYGLSGKHRFPHEMNVAGSDTVIILQGINDIIHPVGIKKNEFRPWSDMPTCQDLIDGLKEYIDYAKSLGMKVYVGTLIPFGGWRTYADFRENIRLEFNEWIRNCEDLDGVIDFDQALKDEENEHYMKPIYDSGDHLHPSKKGYQKMAQTAYESIKK